MVRSARGSTGTKKEFAIYLAIVIIAGFLLFYLLKDTSQAIAATIFLATVVGTLMFWRFRVAIVFLCLVLLLLSKTVPLPEAIEFMNLDVILFLVGMMVIVAQLRQSGFFRWLLAKGLRLTRFEPYRLLIMILALAAVTAALVDEVTSILFTTALVLDLCDYFETNPVKYVVSVILATNIGSSWTVLGNPIGILITLRSGLTFEDFAQFALPVGVVSLLCLIPMVLIWLRKDLPELKEKARVELATGGERHRLDDAGVRFLDRWAAIKDKKSLTGSVVIFAGVIIFLILSHRLELWLGLETNTLLFATPICGAGVVMLWQRHQAREFIRRDVDWWTLVFFMFLFTKAGALKYVGLTDVIAVSMLNLARGAHTTHILTLMILWISGFLSAVLDNIVVVDSLIPVVQTLSAQLNTSVFWWALLFGGCYGGNLTMVGSTANIVALGELERRTGHYMTLGYWLKIGLFATLVPMIIGMVALLIFG